MLNIEVGNRIVQFALQSDYSYNEHGMHLDVQQEMNGVSQ